MKSLILSISFIIMAIVRIYAQAPEAFSYQAIARDIDGELITNQDIGIKAGILDGSATGPVLYEETHTITTNDLGLFSIKIGKGSVTSGTFSSIDWGTSAKYLDISLDPNGGSNYTQVGTIQLLSVPYALYSEKSGGDADADPSNEIQDISLEGTELTITQGSTLDLQDLASSTNTDDQALTLEGSELSIEDGNSVDLAPINTDDQQLTLDGTELSIEDGNAVDLTDLVDDADADPLNEIQTLSLVGTDLTISGGNTVNIDQTETDPTVLQGTQSGEIQYWNGTAWITVAPGNEGQVLTLSGGIPAWSTTLGLYDVHNPTTGKIWMDRNLGASQVATSSTDTDAYGDLYQWGRAADGHESRTSGTTSSLSSSDTPGHGDFILAPDNPQRDWRSPQNDNLWQGVNGVNNPCPGGYRLPTQAEWVAERQSWSSNDDAGAFASPLKLTVAGYRSRDDGSINLVDTYGYYSSSTVTSIDAYALYFNNSNANVINGYRANGYSVRCIKD